MKVTFIAAVICSILIAEAHRPQDDIDEVLERFEHLIHITEAWASRPTFD